MVYAHTVKYLRIAPKKLSLMGKEVIGMHPKDASTLLSVQRQKAAHQLATAITAAENNASQSNIDLSKMVVIGVSAQKGPSFMRRFIVSKGRALPKAKPTTHAVIIFGEPKVKKPTKSTKKAEK